MFRQKEKNRITSGAGNRKLKSNKVGREKASLVTGSKILGRKIMGSKIVEESKKKK